MAQVKSLRTGIKFKDTPIGKIPVDWEVTSINNICSISSGSAAKYSKDPKEKKHLVFGSNGIIGSYDNYNFEDGFVIGRVGASGSIQMISSRIWASDNTLLLSIKNSAVVKPFLFYLLSAHDLPKLATKTAQPLLTQTTLGSVYVSLPPLSEQKKISEILTTVDDAIEETDRIIEKIKELKKGLMQRLLTRGIGHKKFKKTEIGEIPVEWGLNRLGEISTVRRGASPRPINDPKWFGGNVGWVRISDVTSARKYLRGTRDHLSEEGVKNSVKIRKGEVILSICATIGRPIIVDMDACIHDGFVWFDGLTQDIDREFLYYFLALNEQNLSAQRQTGTQGNLNTSIISNIYLPIPPQNEQKKIAEILTTVDEEVTEEEIKKQNLKSLKKSLMQVLLTGRVRVKLH